MSETIYQALAAAMRDMAPISKDQWNKQQGFNYRGIEQVYNAAHHAMSKHGIVSTPHKVIARERSERKTAKGNTMYVVALHILYRFYGPDGSYIDVETEGEAMDMADKASAKAQSIAHRTAILQTFTVPYQGMIEPDESPEEPTSLSPEMQQKIAACIEDAKQATNKKKVRALFAEAQSGGYLAYVSDELKKMAAVLPEIKIDELPEDMQKEIAACLEAAKQATTKAMVDDLITDAKKDGYLAHVKDALTARSAEVGHAGQ